MVVRVPVTLTVERRNVKHHLEDSGQLPFINLILCLHFLFTILSFNYYTLRLELKENRGCSKIDGYNCL